MTLRVIVLAASKGCCSKSALAIALVVEAVKERGKVALLDWIHRIGDPLVGDAPEAGQPKLIRQASDPVEARVELGDDFERAFVDMPPTGVDEIGRAIEAADFVLVPVQATNIGNRRRGIVSSRT